jgi:LacI family repressor for deo operon, udp, cdd, tsx, nupC, and nupG
LTVLGEAGRMDDKAGNARPATINDVAALAGVASSTVSRALSKPGRVNRHTRVRIEQAAATLNYVPLSQVRGLSETRGLSYGKTGAVAVLVPDVTNPFYFDIIRGTQMQLKAAGYTQLLVDTEESAQIEAESLENLRESCVGFILGASRLDEEALVQVAKIMHVVVINRSITGIPGVILDTLSGVSQALEHLVSLGHRQVAYVGGPLISWSSRKRWETMETEAARLGISVVKIGAFAPKTTSGAAAADAVLNTGFRACICFNDLIAIGMLQRLRERGIGVPQDISVVGCDDIFGADFCNPPLTTLTAPIEQAGRTAVRMLHAQFSPSYSPLSNNVSVLPTHLTIRSSTGPVNNQANTSWPR